MGEGYNTKNWSTIQIRREDKDKLDALREQLSERLGMKVTVSNMFSVVVKQLTLDEILRKMLDQSQEVENE